jgi:hypothetical protein
MVGVTRVFRGCRGGPCNIIGRHAKEYMEYPKRGLSEFRAKRGVEP